MRAALPAARKITPIRRGSLSYGSVWQWDLDNDCRNGATIDDHAQENVADIFSYTRPKEWKGDGAMGGMDRPGDEGNRIVDE